MGFSKSQAIEDSIRIILKGYSAEHLRGLKWSLPIKKRLAYQLYDDQRSFVLKSATDFFGSALFKANLEIFPLPQWYVNKSRKRRRKTLRQIQRLYHLK